MDISVRWNISFHTLVLAPTLFFGKKGEMNVYAAEGEENKKRAFQSDGFAITVKCSPLV